jgi:hypothetical protein
MGFVIPNHYHNKYIFKIRFLGYKRNFVLFNEINLCNCVYIDSYDYRVYSFIKQQKSIIKLSKESFKFYSMKTANLLTHQILLIVFTVLMFSCQSNTKNSPAHTKKYSEYTDLEKMNLKGEVIGVADYSTSDCKNCYDFTFYNENGNVEKEFDNRDNAFLILRHYIYLNNILRNQINYYLFENNTSSTNMSYFQYDSSLCLQSEMNHSNLYNKIFEFTKYEYDKNGFPKEKISDSKERYYWNAGILDSQILIYDNKILSKKYFSEGRLVKDVRIDSKGNIDKASSFIYTYKLDSTGNDIKLVSTSFEGAKDSSERTIIYKGGDLSIYYNTYIELEAKINKINAEKSTEHSNVNSNNYVAPQPVEKEKIICNRCGGTGQKICERCFGKGETRCYRCNGTGVANDGRRCIYCTGGYERCTGCQGRTRISCDGCAGRGYTNY